MDILFGPDERRGLAGPYRCGKEQTVGHYRRGLLASRRLEGDPDDRTLVFDSDNPARAAGAVFGLSNPAAVGPDRGQGHEVWSARYDRR